MSADNSSATTTVKRLVASIVQFLGDQMSSTTNSLTTDAKESLEGEEMRSGGAEVHVDPLNDHVYHQHRQQNTM